jgi:hypothetical protein
MKKVGVVNFEGNYSYKEYNFITNIEGLEKGDEVVVDTQKGLAVAQFIRYNPDGFGETGVKLPAKWIIQKIDLKAHNERIEKEKELKKLKTQMEKVRKEAQELEIYSILAEKNPAMKEMLDKFVKLQEEV